MYYIYYLWKMLTTKIDINLIVNINKKEEILKKGQWYQVNDKVIF